MATIREQTAGAGIPAVRSVSTVARRRAWIAGWLVSCAGLIGLGAYHWLVYVPHENMPHKLAILDRLFDVAVVAAMLLDGLLLGLRALALMRARVAFSRLERVALATGLGLGVISIGVLILGMLHLYYPATFAIALLALPWLLPSERRWVAQLARGLRSRVTRLLAWRGTSRVDTIACVLLAVVSASTFTFTLVRDLNPAPVLAYDTYQYHWAVPMLLLGSHSMRVFPGWAHADLPYNTEMLNLIALGLRAPEAATLIQDLFNVLTAMLVFAFVRRYFGTTVAWLAVAAEVTVPLLIAYTSLDYVETALIFYGFAALVVVTRWLETVGTFARAGLPLLVLAGVLIGLDLGVKYTGAEYIPSLAVLVVAGLALYAWRRRKVLSPRAVMALGAKAVAGVVGGAALAFGPWAARNWLLLGDPMYPALSGIFSTPLWDSARTKTLEATFQSFGPHDGMVATLHLYALDLFVNPQRYGEGVSFPLGAIAFGTVLLIPFSQFVLPHGWRGATRKQRGQILVVSVLAVSTLLGFGVWTFSGALVERYALPSIILVTVMGAVLCGWLYTHIPQRTVVLSWVLILALVGVCAQQEWMFLFGGGEGGAPAFYHEYAYWTPMPILTGQVSEDALSRQRFLRTGVLPKEYLQMVDYANTTLPHNGKLLVLGRGIGYFFQDREYVADSAGDWVPYLVSRGKTPRGILQLLRAQGFTYVVYDGTLMRYLVRGYQNHVLASYLPTYLSFQQCTLDYVATWGGVSLYRVPAPNAMPSAGSSSGALTSPMRRCGGMSASRSP